MPLVDWFGEKWQHMRAERARGEKSRQKVFRLLNAEEKHKAYQEIAYLLSISCHFIKKV